MDTGFLKKENGEGMKIFVKTSSGDEVTVDWNLRLDAVDDGLRMEIKSALKDMFYNLLGCEPVVQFEDDKERVEVGK